MIIAAGTPASATQAHTQAFIRALTAAVVIRAPTAAGGITAMALCTILVGTPIAVMDIVVRIAGVDITIQVIIQAMGALIIPVVIPVHTTAIIKVPIIAVHKTATQARTQAFIRALIAAEFIQVRWS